MTAQSLSKVEWLLRESDGDVPIEVSENIAIDTEGWTARIERIDPGTGLRFFLISATVRDSQTVTAGNEEPGLWLCSNIVVRGGVEIVLSDGPRAQVALDRSILFRADEQRGSYTLARHPSLRLLGFMARGDRVRQMLGDSLPDTMVALIERRGVGSALFTAPACALLRKVAAQLFTGDLHGQLRLMFMEGVTLQLLAMQVASLVGQASERKERVAPRMVEEAREHLLADMRHPPSLAELAAHAGMTEKVLNNAFRARYGGTAFEILRDERLEHARIALEAGGISMRVVAHRVGYNQLSNFSRAFARRFGVPPSRYAKRRQIDL